MTKGGVDALDKHCASAHEPVCPMATQRETELWSRVAKWTEGNNLSGVSKHRKETFAPVRVQEILQAEGFRLDVTIRQTLYALRQDVAW